MEIRLIETFDDSKVIEQLDKIEKSLTDIAHAGDDVGQSLSKGLSEGEKAADSLNESLNDNAKAMNESAKAVESNQKNLSAWRGALKDSINGINIMGRSLGEWRTLFIQSTDAIGKTEGATKKLTVVQQIFNAVLKASPIGLIITAIAGLLAYFTRFQTGIDTLSAGVAAANKVLSTLLDRIALIGSAIANFATGNFSAGVNDLKDSVDGLGSALAGAAEDAFSLERRLQALRDAQIEASVSFARQEAVLQKLKTAAQDETLSFQARTQAIREAGELEQRIGSTKLELAKENLDILQQQTTGEQIRLQELVRGEASAEEIAKQRRLAEREAANTQIADRQKLAEAEIAVVEAQSESDKIKRSLEKELREIRKKASEERKQQLEAERKATEQIIAGLEKLRVAAEVEGVDRDLAAVNKKYDDLAKIAADGVKTLKDIEARRGLTPEEIDQLQEFADLSVQIEARRLESLVDVLSDYNEKELEAEEEQLKRREDLTQREFDDAVARLEARRDLNDQLIELSRVQGEGVIARLEASGASATKIAEAQEELDIEIQARRLQNLIEFQQKLLNVESDPARVQSIINEIKILQAELANLDIDNGDERRKPKSIFELLGIEDEGTGEGLAVAVAQIQAALEDITAARVKAAEEQTRIADDRVRAAEEEFERERSLNEEGLASDVSLAKQRLNTEKALREQAFKEEQRAKRAQIALQSVEQVSSLITASANVFESVSNIPFIGVPLAIGIIASMFGAFAVSKARALQAVADVPKLRTGAKLKGLSHESGGVPLYVDGMAYEAERDEWLIGTDASREHDRFLSRLNKGDFKGVDLDGMLARHQSDYRSPLGEASPRIVQIERDKAKAEVNHNFAAMQSAYLKGSKEVVEAIKGQPIIKPWNGGYIEEKVSGGMKTRTKVVPE